MKKWWKFISDYFKNRRKENERDLSSFESDLNYILKLVYIKEKLDKDNIKKKCPFGENRFEEIMSFAVNEGYLGGLMDGSYKYRITPKALEFLLEFRNSKIDKKNNTVIVFATIVLATSALVSLINLLLENERTRNFVFSWTGKIIAETLKALLVIFLVFLSIALVVFIFNTIKRILVKKEVIKGKI